MFCKMADTNYVSKGDSWDLEVPGSGNTPSLGLGSQKAGTIVRISTNFMARIKYGGGFYYKFSEIDSANAEFLTPSTGVLQQIGRSGWNSCTHTAYLKVISDGYVGIQLLFSEYGNTQVENAMLYSFLLEYQIVD